MAPVYLSSPAARFFEPIPLSKGGGHREEQTGPDSEQGHYPENHGETGPRLPHFTACGDQDEQCPDPLETAKKEYKLRQTRDRLPLHQKNERKQHNQNGEECQVGTKEVRSQFRCQALGP